MISVTPFCHEHSLGMHLVSAMVHGMGEESILLYARPNEACERRYFEDAGGYGRLGDGDDFVPIPEWQRKAAPLSVSAKNEQAS